MQDWHPGHCFILLLHTAERAISHAAVRKLRNALVLPAKMCVAHVYVHANQDFEIINQVSLHFGTRKFQFLNADSSFIFLECTGGKETRAVLQVSY
jgi:hypothetical protein